MPKGVRAFLDKRCAGVRPDEKLNREKLNGVHPAACQPGKK